MFTQVVIAGLKDVSGTAIGIAAFANIVNIANAGNAIAGVPR